MVRTRFAPSPTGELHLGNARTAILNWLVARRHGGAFVLRLEDTDVDRASETSEARIVEALDWLGLDRDEGPAEGGPHAPYRQSERLTLYRARAERLVEEGSAYRCYCRPAEVEERHRAAVREGRQATYDGRCRALEADEAARLRAAGRHPAVRFRVEPGPVRFEDRVAGEVVIDGADFGDFVILRSDGRPTYNFAVVVDDLEMEISHVIRGSGHLSNTPKQVLLYRAFGTRAPVFVHVPTVLGPEGGKLSKRAGARSVLWYRDAGYHPEAVVNYLSLLSWSPGDDRELLSREELIETLDLDRLGTANPRLDEEKMRWLSGQHVRGEPVERLAQRLAPYLGREGVSLDPEGRVAAAELVRPRIHLLAEGAEEVARLLAPPDLAALDVEAALREPGAVDVLEAAADAWEAAATWKTEPIREALEAAGRRAGAVGGALYRPVRAALTGALRGPELPRVARVLGRARCVERLRAAARAEAADGARGATG